ncbi:DUF4870 domain-containing protein [Balneolales bacterium ANBcel1]|nr:DUF4870 domain-containing protein [Balneolales bacterium ANBcel1]
MSRSEVSRQIREKRSALGWSQDLLAEKAGVNIRTIQRIEAGDTTPRGDTLQRIAEALGVATGQLTRAEEGDTGRYLHFINLSLLGMYVHFLLWILAPLLIWVVLKDRDRAVDRAGKQILNYQFTVILLVILISVLSAWFYQSPLYYHIAWSEWGRGWTRAPFPNHMFLITLGYVWNIVMVGYNSWRIRQKKSLKYFPAIPWGATRRFFRELLRKAGNP